MPDLDQLFAEAATRVATPGQDAPTAPVARGEDEAVRGQDEAVRGQDEAVRGQDEAVVDLQRLVTEWNRQHEPTTPERGRSRQEPRPKSRRRVWAVASARLAEHIGSFPTQTAQAPEPIDVARTEEVLAGPGGGIRRNRAERRRSRREIDRLQRECARRPLPDDGPAGDVTLLGALPASPASLAQPTPVGNTRPATVAPVDPLSPLADPAPAGHSGRAGRKARRRSWKATERELRARARGQVRFPIFTRSVLVWCLVFLLAGLGFGASSAFWWAQFNSEVEGIRAETTSFADQVAGASGALTSQREAALTEIEAAMEPLGRLAQPGLALQVASAVAPSTFLVETLTVEGAPSVGSAFVVGVTEEEALLVTSLAVVEAATASPGPDVVLRRADRELPARVWSWDRDTDLALLLVDDPSLPALAWAGEDVAASAVGSGVFAVAGLGGSGASAVPGLVVDASVAGFQHTAAVGTAYRGGPLVTADGAVLAVASTAYQPLGFDPGAVPLAVPVGAACGTVLDCTGGVPTVGAEGGPTLEETDPAPTEGAPADGQG